MSDTNNTNPLEVLGGAAAGAGVGGAGGFLAGQQIGKAVAPTIVEHKVRNFVNGSGLGDFIGGKLRDLTHDATTGARLSGVETTKAIMGPETMKGVSGRLGEAVEGLAAKYPILSQLGLNKSIVDKRVAPLLDSVAESRFGAAGAVNKAIKDTANKVIDSTANKTTGAIGDLAGKTVRSLTKAVGLTDRYGKKFGGKYGAMAGAGLGLLGGGLSMLGGGSSTKSASSVAESVDNVVDGVLLGAASTAGGLAGGAYSAAAWPKALAGLTNAGLHTTSFGERIVDKYPRIGKILAEKVGPSITGAAMKGLTSTKAPIAAALLGGMAAAKATGVGTSALLNKLNEQVKSAADKDGIGDAEVIGRAVGSVGGAVAGEHAAKHVLNKLTEKTKGVQGLKYKLGRLVGNKDAKLLAKLTNPKFKFAAPLVVGGLGGVAGNLTGMELGRAADKKYGPLNIFEPTGKRISAFISALPGGNAVKSKIAGESSDMANLRARSQELGALLGGLGSGAALLATRGTAAKALPGVLKSMSPGTKALAFPLAGAYGGSVAADAAFDAAN